MIIKEIFNKSIDRHISGVIKIGNGEENKKQELEEYVVTRELSKYFKQFFEKYNDISLGAQSEIGVWISGFYGSGKSHFMKILSYILDNEPVDGKKPVDYFVDDEKINDFVTVANMKKAAEMSSDVILFDIESMSQDKGYTKEAVLQVFERVFNEKLGYDGAHPSIAEVERYMDNNGTYDAFKKKYQEITGKEWSKDTKNIKFRRKAFVEAVTSLGIMAEEDAVKAIDNVHQPYRGSISDFAQLISEYCERKGNDHRVIFLADEVGQYIADDVSLLINLQTLSEDFSTYCKGHAWIVVTSQQNIDEVTHVQGEDFSKIQARFHTRLSLSSSDVAEVIQKRILDKTPVAKQTLESYYATKEAIIKNLIDFSEGGQFKRKYTDAKNFADVYPFIPYQFDLLRNVLEQVRIHSSSGKHLAEGERSMLALVQESAQSVENREIGALVSFNKFYDCLEQWIDHTYRNVIDSARRNDNLEDYDVEVLKVLYMIKYVKEIQADIKNVTTLMVDHVDNDRVDLTKKVQESLDRLVKETYVQKDGIYYAFLTNAEQDLNRAIANEKVEQTKIVNRIKDIIFGDLYTTGRFKYSPRYNFPFNTRIDDNNFVTGNPIGLVIVTPYNDKQYTSDQLRQLSMGENVTVFEMPNEIEFINDLTYSLKLEQYLTKNASNNEQNFVNLRGQKQAELAKVKGRVKDYIESSLRNATIYVNGSEVPIPAKPVKDRIDEGLSKLVNNVYNKLSYMKTQPGPADLLKIFTKPENMTLGDLSNDDNQLALDEMLKFIQIRDTQAIKVSYKNILDKFKDAPYGWVNDDIHWLVLRLFKDRKIDLILNGEVIQTNELPYNLTKYVTDSKNYDRLIINVKPMIDSRQIKAVNDICKELDPSFQRIDESDTLMQKAKELFDKKLDELQGYLDEYATSRQLPGKTEVTEFRDLLRSFKSEKAETGFFKLLDDKYDVFMGRLDRIDPVVAFFNGSQKEIYKESVELDRKAEASRTYITDDQDLQDLLKKIKDIINSNYPYNSISKLPGLNKEFNEKFQKKLDDVKARLYVKINNFEGSLKDMIKDNETLTKIFNNSIEYEFRHFRNAVEHAETIGDAYNVGNSQMPFKYGEFKKKITAKEAELNQQKASDEKGAETPSPKIIVRAYDVNDLFDNVDKTFRTEQEIDLELANLKKKLMKGLEEGNAVRIKVK